MSQTHGDVATETSTLNTEVDTVRSSITWALGANIENLTLIGTAAINRHGNTLSNILVGDGEANTLDGGDGNDALNGGAGVDTLIGGVGNDTYYVENAADVTTETGTLTTEIDTVVDARVTSNPGGRISRLTSPGQRRSPGPETS